MMSRRSAGDDGGRRTPPIEILLATTEGLEALLGTSCQTVLTWELGCRLAASSKTFYEAVRAYRHSLRQVYLRGIKQETMLRLVGRDCPQLQSMGLTSYQIKSISSKAIRSLLVQLPMLEELTCRARVLVEVVL